MKDQLNKVKEFHRAFNHPAPGKITHLEMDRMENRINWINEEIDEYEGAAITKNIVEVADALGDALYLILGTIVEHGLEDVMEKVFDEIHASNMSKLGENGEPIYRMDGKIMKGDNYFRPNIAKIIENHG